MKVNFKRCAIKLCSHTGMRILNATLYFLFLYTACRINVAVLLSKNEAGDPSFVVAFSFAFHVPATDGFRDSL